MDSSDWVFENIHLNIKLVQEIAHNAHISLETHTFSILCQNRDRPTLLIYKMKHTSYPYYIINLRTLEASNDSQCKIPLTEEIAQKMKSFNIYSVNASQDQNNRLK